MKIGKSVRYSTTYTIANSVMDSVEFLEIISVIGSVRDSVNNSVRNSIFILVYNSVVTQFLGDGNR